MTDYPFLKDSYLSALEHSGAVTAERGWQPCHLAGESGWVPLYLRSHSRGEYVFDYSWADAYQRHGLAYYPKLVTAIPFTPVTGPRWRGSLEPTRLWEGVQERMNETGASGWHLLFPDQACRDALVDLPLAARQACHFRWLNRDYSDFEDYLARFQSRKRKNLRKERQRVAEQGVTIERVAGPLVSAEQWRVFYQCYASTYLKRGQLPYLGEDFFLQLAQTMASQILLVLASRNDKPIAAALYFLDAQQLYGRYWGCLEEVDGLHFELCYYQGIEHAIAAGLQVFDPGVQGEHKILRGFEPVITWSLHYLREPGFQNAIMDFCQEEAVHVHRYRDEAMTLLPFRKDGG
ncbi:GNAT family N-acetyltransferase [Alcanivorax sediminis]|uniref:GNAT family N-acetyltransferase n=1 Tax=Alcanivorax sediminis TaxID=2663008 RepID=A0A6N7LRY0_9GAMM|nr:GNAT family N-acetyltransferase [Alcanivorax sediminis]MQX53178.1 GNAT family N-acetyltransferase [Alcanivorax sediminis]